MCILRYLRPAFLCLALALGGCMSSTGSSLRAGPETEQVAEAAWSVGEYEEAARLFERAAQRDPTSVNALIGLGKSYTELGQYSRAGGALGSAAALRPRNASIHSEMGKLALYQGNAEAALEHYDAALRIDRRNLPALTGKAVSLDYLSRHLEAQETYRQALKIYPTNFALLSNNALSLAISGDRATGIAILEELLGDAQNGETVRANLAIAYILDDRKQEARAMLAGLMSEREVDEELRLYSKMRQELNDGKTIGHLIFQ